MGDLDKILLQLHLITGLRWQQDLGQKNAFEMMRFIEVPLNTVTLSINVQGKWHSIKHITLTRFSVLKAVNHTSLGREQCLNPSFLESF